MANCPSCHREVGEPLSRTFPIVTVTLVVLSLATVYFVGLEDSVRRYILMNNLPLVAVGLGLAFERWLGR